ncbi:hypothetical protein PR048_000165, partial [Dryococelus australis]
MHVNCILCVQNCATHWTFPEVPHSMQDKVSSRAARDLEAYQAALKDGSSMPKDLLGLLDACQPGESLLAGPSNTLENLGDMLLPGDGTKSRTFPPSEGPGVFPCMDCGKAYRWKRTLRHHMRYECGQEPRFQCPYCSLRSKRKGNIITHVRSVHDKIGFCHLASSGDVHSVPRCRRKLVTVQKHVVCCSRYGGQLAARGRRVAGGEWGHTVPQLPQGVLASGIIVSPPQVRVRQGQPVPLQSLSIQLQAQEQPHTALRHPARAVMASDNLCHVSSPVLPSTGDHNGVVVKLLTSHQSVLGSIPSKVALDFHMWGNCTGRCHWLAGFLDNLPFPPPTHSGVAPYSPCLTLKSSQDLDVKSHPDLFTSLHFYFCDWLLHTTSSELSDWRAQSFNLIPPNRTYADLTVPLGRQPTAAVLLHQPCMAMHSAYGSLHLFMQKRVFEMGHVAAWSISNISHLPHEEFRTSVMGDVTTFHPGLEEEFLQVTDMPGYDFGESVVHPSSTSTRLWDNVKLCHPSSCGGVQGEHCLCSTSEGPGVFPCEGCGKQYRWKRTLLRHKMYECHKEYSFQCPYCPLRSKRKWNVNKHVRAVHPGNTTLELENVLSPFVAELMTHHVYKRVISYCKTCLWSKKRQHTKQENVMRGHVVALSITNISHLAHGEVRSAATGDAVLFQPAHERAEPLHGGSDMHRSSNSSRPRNIRNIHLSSLGKLHHKHSKSLSFEGPGDVFPCASCGKQYHWKSTLLRHMRYECGKTAAFQCPYCPQRSKWKGNINAHIKAVHPDK